MGINRNFVVKNGLEVNSNQLVVNADTGFIGIASTGPNTQLDVRGGIAATDLNITGVATIATYKATIGIATNALLTNAEVTGIGTVETLIAANNRGTNLNITGVGTIGFGEIAHLDGTNINYTGVGTIATLNGDQIIAATALRTANLNATGVTTISDLTVEGTTVDSLTVNNFSNLSGITTIDTLLSDVINVSGVSTVSLVEFRTGIITHSDPATGIVTYYGDGSQLQFLPGASPGGSDTQVQFNAAGVFSGHSGFTYNYQTVSMSSLNVSTGATFAVVNVGTGITLNNTGINVTGIATVNGFEVTGGSSIGVDVRTRNLNVSGIATVGTGLTLSTDLIDGGTTVRILGENLRVAGVVTCQDVDSLSDINFKENVNTVDGALDKVSELRGVSFNWKESGEPSYGVIAQELENVLPELVHGDDPKRVNYNGIIGVLIEAIKELKAEVEELKK
jgi:hypothetical protein|tara:strand:- start:1382 stop:2734 length:1353 start_codon:yes stop_codon:yes gene_type:complete